HRDRARGRPAVDRCRAALRRAARATGRSHRRARGRRDRVPEADRRRSRAACAHVAPRVGVAVDVRMILKRLRDLLIWISGGALLVAVAVDTLAMIGRQIAIPLIGSIEIVQAVVLFAASGGLIIATL